MFSFDEIKEMKPMSYWAFKGTSANLKAKFAKAMETGYILTLKRDGALYRAMIGKDETLLQSRTISKKTGEFVNKADNVPEIIEQLNASLPKDTILMGEICYPIEMGNTISSDVVSIMGCLPAKAIERQKITPLNYYIFDVLMWNGEPTYQLPYLRRLDYLAKVRALIKDKTRLETAEPISDNIEKTVENYLENGWEGGVLMKKDEPYVFEKRPAWTSIKVKQSADTIDLVIMGTTPPVKAYTGKYPASHLYWEKTSTGELLEGSYYNQPGYMAVSSNYFEKKIGGLSLGAYYNDRLIEVSKVANLTDEMRDNLTENFEAWKGTVVEVSCMMIDPKRKSLRHPKIIRFREDKNPEECLYNDIFG